MILVAGLTPAWQQVLSFQEFVPGEVNRAAYSGACASGKVLNVGCALFHLGVEARTLCPIGGMTGQQLCDEFSRLKIPVRWIWSNAATRTCTTILEEETGRTTELVENSHPLSEVELNSYFEAFIEEVPSASTVVISGSMPEGTPGFFFHRLLEHVSVPCVLDIRGAELRLALPMNPFVVKPNREELAKTVGRQLESESDLIEAMSEIRHLGARWVVVSQGPSPLIALGPEGVIKVEPPAVKVRNPIGCGDCLAAGIAAGLDRKLPMRAAIEIGIRAAAENAQTFLPARDLTRLA